MKEYKLGDMKKYDWNKDNFLVLLSLIKCIMISLYMAFKKYGFIHNDVHFGNILIKETTRKELLFDERISVKLYGYEPKIMDFETINKKIYNFLFIITLLKKSKDFFNNETSLFDESKSNYVILYKILIQIVNGIRDYLNIITNNTDIIQEYLLLNLKNNVDINIEHLLSLINNIEFIDKIDMYKKLVYNPNIF
jgi:hypothetical protein